MSENKEEKKNKEVSQPIKETTTTKGGTKPKGPPDPNK